MKVRQIAALLSARVLCDDGLLDAETSDVFCCDMMSDVLAYTKNNGVLLSGLCNPQVIRTAEMMD